MSAYGLSPLEIKHLIERALLPDRCQFSEQDGLLTLRLCRKDQPDACVSTVANLDTLLSSRAIAELVGEARYLLAHAEQSSSHPPAVKRLPY
jgi:hypothetical protein